MFGLDENASTVMKESQQQQLNTSVSLQELLNKSNDSVSDQIKMNRVFSALDTHVVNVKLLF